MAITSGHALIADALMNAPFDEMPSPYIVTRLAEHVGAADKWQDLSDRPYLLDTLDPDSVAAAALRTAYGRSALPPAIAASLSARHLLKRLQPPDRLMTRWIAAACGWSAPDAEPRAWANIGYREPAHIVLTGHRGAVLSVAALRTLDGIAIASAGNDATLRIWNPTTGRAARHQIDTGPVVTTVVGLRSADGRLLAGVSDGGAVQVWNWQTGAQIFAIPAGRPTGRGLLASLPQPDGSEFLCAGTVRGDLRVWQVGADGTLTLAAALIPPSPVRMIASLPRDDGRTSVVTAGYDGAVHLWDVPTEAVVGLAAYASGGIEAIAGAEAPDGGHMLVVAEDGEGLDLIAVDDDLPFRAHRTTLRSPRDRIACVAVISDARILASGNRSGLIRLWRHTGDAWHPTTAMAGHSGAIVSMMSISLTDGRTMLVTGGEDATVRLWHPDTAPEDRPAADDLDLVTVCATTRFGPDEVLATGSNRGVVQTWDIRSGHARPGLRFEDRGAIYALVAVDLGNETVVATAGTERLVRIWNARTGDSVVDPLQRHQDTIHALAVVRNADGILRIASAGADRTIRLWDPRSGRAVGTPLVGHRASIEHLAVVSLGGGPDLLVSVGSEPVVLVWRPTDGDEYIEGEFRLDSNATAIAASGELVLVGCAGGEIHGYNASRRESLGVIAALDGGVPLALAVFGSSDDTLIVIGTDSGEIQIWSLRNRRRLRTTLLPLHLRPEAIAVAADRLAIRTQRGLLGCQIDPRVFADYQPAGFRSQRGSIAGA
ncbi:hypothetical protein HH310_19800 [Actinoplanes sp. TBRC 11911]|uniref:WD40 repeat domain-containing protein n=1 Tax=Actinoplanes sp. TBRC 11911 TaxID=2729386 RepID=UPI00145E0A3C|nr:hypothetical protein [Actinoplanes sp. TBRC 11911]NMO53421.1 hypothetical protein [Actinoplanes sp. TBRC 11911]